MTQLERVPPVVLIAIGGALGSLVRVALIDACASQLDSWMTTTAINFTGSALAGFTWATLSQRSREAGRMRRLAWSAVVISGFCGGFTTFSGFGLQMAELARDGRLGAAIANLWISLFIAMGGAMLGALLARAARAPSTSGSDPEP